VSQGGMKLETFLDLVPVGQDTVRRGMEGEGENVCRNEVGKISLSGACLYCSIYIMFWYVGAGSQ
jgi:hypothetical protein